MPALAAMPILFAVVMSFASTAIGIGLNLVFKKKPNKPVTGGENQTITVKQPVSPWQTIYGSRRVGGTLFFLERDGNDVWMAVVWAGHEIKAIDSIYTDDTQNLIEQGGECLGDNFGLLRVYNHLGDPDQTYDTTLAGVFPLLWTSDHRLRGRAYSIFQFVNLSTNWNNTIPNVSADIRGRLIPDSRTGTETFTDNAVQCISDMIQNEDFGLAEPARSIDTANINSESNIADQEVDIPNWSEHWKPTSITFTVNIAGVTNQFNCGTGNDIDFGGRGDSVYVTSTLTLPAPLVAGTEYFFGWGTASNNTTFDLHTTRADAIAGTNAIDITSGGTGTRTIVNASRGFRMLGRETTFTASAGADTITFSDKLFRTAEALDGRIRARFETTGTMPAPLTAGTLYYVNGSNQVFSSVFGSFIDITTAGTGTHTLRLHGQHSNINNFSAATDIVTLDSSNDFKTGAQVQFLVSGGSLPAPLAASTTYFWIALSSTTGRVALTLSDAEVGKAIDLADAGSGAWTIETLSAEQDEVLGATTGTVVNVVVSSGVGSLPAGLSANTDYYFIRQGRGYFQLASTLQNALNGTAIAITDPGSDTNLTYKVTLKRERRFTVNTVFDADQDKRDVLKGMANAIGMGAILEPLGTGKWRVKSGTYKAPTGSLTLAHIRKGGVPEVTTRLERRSAANTIKGVYNSPLNFDQASDFPAVSDPRYVTEDDDEVLVEDITLPATNSKNMARRIATSWLKRKRAQRSIRWPATLAAGFKYEYGDTLCVTLPLLGWVNKVMRVEGWEMIADPDEGGIPIPRIDLILREASPSAFS